VRPAMTTEKQIAANRANAKRSTGPRTLAGKIKSSGNAFRHGLSLDPHLDSTSTARLDAIANALVSDGATEQQFVAATGLAKAHLELLRIRTERYRMMATIDLQSGNPDDFRRLQALDRYERYAHTRRRRAFHELQTQNKVASFARTKPNLDAKPGEAQARV
jgi:hypothetical protein